MPQMMPLLWMPLFIMVTFLLIISALKVYYSVNKFNCAPQESNKTLLKVDMKWMW